jgi:RNA-directed DNA polymerase
VNTDAPWPTLSVEEAEARVLGIQTKLHHRATDDPGRRFDDLFNLVCDPAFLLVAWRRVKGNKGARTAGVDGRTAFYVSAVRGEDGYLADLRAELKARRFRPLPVAERLIPKPGGSKRRLGIPTVADRVVQAALKLVLEPIFEADFQPCSYGFRPGRRAQDTIAEIHHLTSRPAGYEWVLEGDITACFDTIDHTALIQRVRRRIGDRRVLALIKAFCKAGILTQDGARQDTITGTPQGGILSPLLANIALSVLDEHFTAAWEGFGPPWTRKKRTRKGLGTWRLVRYADDFVVLVKGTRAHAQALWEQAAAVLAPMGLRLSVAKTRITHIDEGFDFLGFRIQRRRRQGTTKRYVYTYPSKKALVAIVGKVRTLTHRTANRSLAVLLYRLNPVLRGWCAYFRHGVSSRTFGYLEAYAWRRILRWLRRRHPHSNWKTLRRAFLPGWLPTQDGVAMFRPSTVRVSRYRYRGHHIPTPWATATGPTRRSVA